MGESKPAAGITTGRYGYFSDVPQAKRSAATIKKQFTDADASGKFVPSLSRKKIVKAMESAEPKGMGHNPEAPEANRWCYMGYVDWGHDSSNLVLIENASGVGLSPHRRCTSIGSVID